MKVGVITFHQALNYGAVLQTYALQNYIMDNFKSIDIDLIDYQCPYFNYIYGTKNKNGRFIHRLVKKTHVVLKKRLFRNFVKKYIMLGETFTNETIKHANCKYDKFIVGSDQVWNCKLTNNDFNYLLAFSSPEKRYSYAASIGISKIPVEFEDVYFKELSLFNVISVREQQAADTLKKLFGDTEKAIYNHIDPVMLLPVERWENLCAKIKRKNEDFVLVFSVAYSEELIETAIKYANSKGMKVYYVGQYTRNKNVKYIPLLSVEHVVSLFRDANCIFVNSFHGTVFSILFHKPFNVLMAHSDGRNDRIKGLLEQFSLSDRVGENIEENIDWRNVDCILEKERMKSYNYLKEILI